METLTVRATLESLELISAFIKDAVVRAGLDERAAWQVELAVDEAATNIIQHGYIPEQPGMIEVRWVLEPDALRVQLRDQGRRFDPEHVPAPDLELPLEERQAGGLGLYLMGRLMDTVQFDFSSPHENVLTMTKRRSHPGPVIQTLELSGRLDAVGTTSAMARIRAAVAEGARFVLLDMQRVTFMSSSGLRALLVLRKELLARGGELRLCRLQQAVQEVFDLTGFSRVFAIHASREDAQAAFGQGHS